MGEGTGRRRFLQVAAGAAVTAMAFPAEAARRLVNPRAVAFHNLHTGERFSDVYWSNGRYVPDALRHINWVLRDFRNGEVHPIDPRLIDLLALLHHRLHSREPFMVVSGYRSAETNAMLASLSDGVAQNSYHMRGRAIDLRLPAQRLKRVRAAAMSLKAGGVGYYPHSDFVHLDTGPIRHW
jgi:uncharacterized protein YcbK (DUF882 family)